MTRVQLFVCFIIYNIVLFCFLFNEHNRLIDLRKSLIENQMFSSKIYGSVIALEQNRESFNERFATYFRERSKELSSHQ